MTTHEWKFRIFIRDRRDQYSRHFSAFKSGYINTEAFIFSAGIRHAFLRKYTKSLISSASVLASRTCPRVRLSPSPQYSMSPAIKRGLYFNLSNSARASRRASAYARARCFPRTASNAIMRRVLSVCAAWASSTFSFLDQLIFENQSESVAFGILRALRISE